MTGKFSRRPEARWATWAGMAGAVAVAALSVRGIHSSDNATAALGYAFVPLLAVLGAIPAGVWGAALGHVVLRLRGAVRSPGLVFAAALAAAAALPLAVAYEVWRGTALQSAVREVRAMDVLQLERSFEQSPWNRDKYFLGAIALNPAAHGALLARIASIDDPELYEPMGSIWDLMGENRKGIAVMRLVARHPNAGSATLEKLAARPGAGYVLHEVLANPNTPVAVLARHFDSTESLVEWGLALNPKTPQRVLARLAASSNQTTRVTLAANKATPYEVLERLAQDPDPSVARSARTAIERRR